MKNFELIAKRYAKALMSVIEPKESQQIGDELNLLLSLFEQSEPLNNLLFNKVFSIVEKTNTFEKILKNLGLNQKLCNFLNLLIIKDRINLLPDIIKMWVLLEDEKEKRLRVKITSYSELGDEEIKPLRDILSTHNVAQVIIEKSVDKALLAGMRVELKGLTFDGSLKSRLKDMELSLLYGTKNQ